MADENSVPHSRSRHVLLSGGGSGGHVFPALAVGDELARRGWRVSFAGNAAGMERRLVAERGIDFVPLVAEPLVGRSLFGQGRAAARLVGSALAARREIRRRGIDAVVGTGAYASAPAVVGAALARRPTLLVEPNAKAGVANHWLSRFAAAAATAYETTGGELRCPSFVTGVPVREAFFEVPALAIDAPPRLLVLGGSQGSQRLNRLLPTAVAIAAAELPELAVVHQCGERNLDAARELWCEAGVSDRVELVPFVSDVAAAMAAAALIVSRAGAITLAEICAAGRPSILLPLELAGGHQSANADRLAAEGAARLLAEATATPAALAALVVELFAERAALLEMAARARRLARAGAAAAIADRVEALVGRGRR